MPDQQQERRRQPSSGSGAEAAASPSTTPPDPHTKKPRSSSSFLSEFATSGVSVATATCVTNPLDVVKTRMQLYTAATGGGASAGGAATAPAPAAAAAAPPPPGMLATGWGIVRAEGVVGLWAGLPPALMRGLLYGGLRLGLYSPTRDWLAELEHGGSNSSSGTSTTTTAAAAASPLAKVAAGALSGGVAAAATSPTELVKVRLQASEAARRAGALAAARAVVAAGGIRALWKGAMPGLVRASVLTASQCATYDETKRRVMRLTGWPDGARTHAATALAAGLASTAATNPVDVVKTHMFAAASGSSSGGSGIGSGGALACARDIFQKYGAKGFARGFAANYARLGPQTLVTFAVAEQLRRLAGLQAL